MNVRSRLLPLWLLLLGFGTGSALYEDQIGKFDWKLQLLGRPRHVVSLSDTSSSSARLIIASDKNVLASLNPETGEVIWRRVLETGTKGSITSLQSTPTGDIATLIGSHLLRVWNTATGLLVSETVLKTERCSNSSVRSVHAAWSRDHSQLTLYHVTTDSQCTVLTVNMRSLQVISDVILQADWLDSVDSCVASPEFLLCITPTHLHSLSLSGAAHSLPLPDQLQQPLSLQLITAQLTAVKDSSGRMMFVTIESGRLAVGERLDRVAAVCSDVNVADTGSELGSGSTRLRVLMYSDKARVVSSLLSAERPANEAITSRALSLPDHVTDVSQCHVIGSGAAAAGAGGGGDSVVEAVRLLVIGTDHSVTATEEDGGVRWLREEALASISATELVDLPISSNLVRVEEEFDQRGGGVFWSLLHRLASQWSQLLDLVISFSHLTSTQHETSSEKRVRDKFNMDKILLLATEPGKLFGIDTSTGLIRWRHNLPPNSGRLLLMALQRGTAHASHAAQLVLVTSKPLLLQLEPVSGHVLARESVQRTVLQASLLQITDEAFVKPLLILDTSLKVHVFPSSAEPLVKSVSHSLFFHSVDKQTGLARGFSVSQDLRAVPMWQHDFSAGGSVNVRQVALKSSHERVHSQGVVLTDRSVLYKYINPNLMVLLAETSDPVYKSCVTVFVIDTVTGQIVYSHVQRRSRCPCQAVHSENWLIYSSYNEKARRTELNSIELFESSSQNNATAFSSLDNPPIPLVHKQSFIFPTHIEAMTHTITEKGITAKFILFVLPSGSILEMARAMLDPRRAVLGVAGDGGVGSGDARATLPVYVPELSVNSQSMVNYNNSVAGCREVITWPSGLESTSLVLAYGLDLYWTRVFPSRMFDQLKDDFECWLIVVVLSGLLFACLLSRRLAQRKSLKQAWT